jgi:glucose/arabinose dehydrogenase
MPEPGGNGASTAFARATLGDTALTNVEVVFRQEPKVSGNGHFGGRIVFSGDSHVPDGQPLVGRTDAKPEIWSYGHRRCRVPRSTPRPARSGRSSSARKVAMN